MKILSRFGKLLKRVAVGENAAKNPFRLSRIGAGFLKSNLGNHG